MRVLAKRLFGLTVLLASGATLQACEEAGRCDVNDDCGAAQVCESGQCLQSAGEGQPCRDDGSCNADSNVIINGSPAQLLCSASSRCVLPGDEGTPCSQSADCDVPMICIENLCAWRRSDGDPCDDDEVCASGYCHPIAQTCGKSTEGEVCDARAQCPDYLACIDETCSKPLSTGERCDKGDDCDSRECDADRRCVGRAGDVCQDDGPCGEGLLCRRAVDGKTRCVYVSQKPCADFENRTCSSDSCQTECAVCDTLPTGETGVENGEFVRYVAAYCVAP